MSCITHLAKLNGTVVLQAVIKSDGTVDVIRVVRGLEHGLTDSAIEAIKQWKFRPGKKNGYAVDVALNSRKAGTTVRLFSR